jgi:RNA polymerase sigma factor (sigma-70 family)
MTAVDGGAIDEVGVLVAQWQVLTGQEQKRAGDLIMKRLDPMLRSTVKRFENRGILTGDLYQVAALAVVRLLSKPLRLDYTFAEIAFLKARDALREHVAMQSADIHVSDWKRRSRASVNGVETVKRGANEESIMLESAESEHLEANTDVEPFSVEDQLDSEKLALFLERLSPSKRELLKVLFGLEGRPEASIRELEKAYGVSRTRLTHLRNEALAELKAAIS